MITIRGKEIRPETISMWFNILGFLTSIIFYLSVEHNIYHAPSVKNPTADSLLAINVRLQTQLENLQALEKKLCEDLQMRKQQLATEDIKINKVRSQVIHVINSDWENLSQAQKDQYTDQLINKLKHKK